MNYKELIHIFVCLLLPAASVFAVGRSFPDAMIEPKWYSAHQDTLGKETFDDSKSNIAVFETFMRNIDRFNRYFPQEKVYLHFDNTGYFLDEKIWFKAYVMRADHAVATIGTLSLHFREKICTSALAP